jgi:uncharacterized glyoxalase superfamily protein PhnB
MQSAIIPRLVCRDVEAEIDFCCQTFGAVEGVRRPGPNGKVAHAMMLFARGMLSRRSGRRCQVGRRMSMAARPS